MMAASRALKGLLKVVCLVVFDLLAFYLSLFITWLLREEALSSIVPNLLSSVHFSFAYYVSLWWIPGIFIFFVFYEGLYERNLPFWDEARIMVKAASLAALAVTAIVTLGQMQDRVSRFVLIGTWITSLFALPLFRLWGKRVLYSIGLWKEKVLILGAGNAGRLVKDGLEREKHMGYDVLGFLDDDEGKRGNSVNGKKVFGKIRHFPKFVRELGITTVIIAIPSLSPEKLASLTASVQAYSHNTMVIPDLKGIALLNTNLLHLFYEELFLMNIRNNLKSALNRSIKRLFDLTLSILSMPLFLPFVGIIGLIIRLETPGPAIYAHDRIGRNGRTFRCYKFRTMRRDAEERLKEILENNEESRSEWEKNRKLRDDPRITGIGRFLRKTSLDELPQIFNVLKGQMSLVGPRPVTSHEIETQYKDMASLCFSVPPGVTGLWQVSGRSGTSYDHRIKLDAWYIRNWSLWFDIVILFKTISVVTKREGAY